MEALPAIELFDRVTAVGIICAFAVLVITEKLVWHTRLKRAQDRADRWERVAVEALAAGAQAGVAAAETTVDIVSALPDPALDETKRRR